MTNESGTMKHDAIDTLKQEAYDDAYYAAEEHMSSEYHWFDRPVDYDKQFDDIVKKEYSNNLITFTIHKTLEEIKRLHESGECVTINQELYDKVEFYWGYGPLWQTFDLLKDSHGK